MRRPSQPASPLFRLLIPLSAAFVVTILAMVASLFGNAEAPAARFLNDHGGTLIAGEVTAILGVCALAMTFDRIQTLRNRLELSQRDPSSDPASELPTAGGPAPASPANTDRDAAAGR